MNTEGRGFVYADHAAAEQRVSELRSSLVDLIDELEHINKKVDSLTLANLITNAKFQMGL